MADKEHHAQPEPTGDFDHPELEALKKGDGLMQVHFSKGIRRGSG